MILYNKSQCLIKLVTKPKGQKFKWRPDQSTYSKSMEEMRYWKDDTYDCQAYLVTYAIQIFWLWFTLYIELKHEKWSTSKMVRYESTHFANIDEALK